MASLLDIGKVAALCYLGLVLMLYLFQRQMLYMPTPALAPSPQPAVEQRAFASGELILGGWVVNPGRHKALLYFGGNAEAVEANVDWFKRHAPDYSIYLVPYRGYGGNPGHPNETDLYRDALAIADQLLTDHRQLHLFGRSLGTGIATYVAAHRPVASLVLVSPFESLTAVASGIYWFVPVRWLLRDRYPAAEHVARLACDTLILVAARDRVIVPGHSRRLAAAFQLQTPEIVEVADAGHNDLDRDPAYGRAIAAFLAAR